MLYVNPHPNITVRLERCSGQRYDDGDFISCSQGCEGHFDTYIENECGEFYNPYPNSILSWMVDSSAGRNTGWTRSFGQ